MSLKQWNEWNEDDRGAVKEGCISFYDADADVVLNVVSMGPDACVPRVGERVWLPGEARHSSDGHEVAEVRYLYAEVREQEHANQACQIGVQVRVRRLA
jgi:hypothetical protein